MTAAAATVPQILDRCPSAAECDELAEEFFELQTKAAALYKAAAAADEPLETLKSQLILLTEEYGQTHAKYSKLLCGICFEIMATFATSRSLDTAAVLRLRGKLMTDRLGKKGRESVFPMLFETHESFSLRPGASEIVRSGKLEPRFLALFAQCEISKAAHPRLVVRQR